MDPNQEPPASVIPKPVSHSFGSAIKGVKLKPTPQPAQGVTNPPVKSPTSVKSPVVSPTSPPSGPPAFKIPTPAPDRLKTPQEMGLRPTPKKQLSMPELHSQQQYVFFYAFHFAMIL